MMTYREGKAFRFNKKTLEKEQEFDMPEEMAEGWGLTHDGKHLYASDGSDLIYKLDPHTFTVISSVRVEDNGVPIQYINELELVGNYIYANVLPLNIILKIEKDTGKVLKKWDMGDLKKSQMASLAKKNHWDSFNNVMNGIAYRKSTDTFLITGKQYGFVFEVKLQ